MKLSSKKYSKREISDGVYFEHNGVYKFVFGCKYVELVAFDKENKWDKKKSSEYCLHRWRTTRIEQHFLMRGISCELDKDGMSVCCIGGDDDI